MFAAGYAELTRHPYGIGFGHDLSAWGAEQHGRRVWRSVTMPPVGVQGLSSARVAVLIGD
jgi:hypothetical protein